MKFSVRFLSICLGFVIMLAFPVVANPINNLNESEDWNEIHELENEILEIVNYGYPRGEIKSNELVEFVDFDHAYKVYSNSDLFDSRSFDKETIMGMLEEGHYIWQIPIFIDGNTILFDVMRITELPDGLSEDVKMELIPQLNKWKLGATYIYSDRIVNYKENVETSLEMSGLNPEEYTYAFVSGLPEIRFPVAVVFGEEAEFIIPAEEATTHVFGDDAEELAYHNQEQVLSSSNSYTKRNSDGFSVYEFKKVAEATETGLLEIGAGGINGLKEASDSKALTLLSFLTILSISACILLKVRKRRKQ